MATTVDITYNGKNEGTLKASLEAQVGENGFKPYEIILGGLGACLNYTFQDVLDKMRLSIDSVDYKISGEKREEVPTILKEVTVDIIVRGVEAGKESRVEKAWEKATQYCSMYETLSRIATMKPTITFE